MEKNWTSPGAVEGEHSLMIDDTATGRNTSRGHWAISKSAKKMAVVIRI